MILALDLETSGLIPKGAVPGSAQFPWPVQVGAVLFDFDGHDRAVFGSRIRSEGRTISTGAQSIHGIGSREAGRTGIPELVAINMVCHFAAEAEYLVGFNTEFDRAILESALIRLGKETRKLIRPGLQVVDLMKPATAFCQVPGEHEDGTFRWPTLSTALEKIRNERVPRGHHDALKDAMGAKRLFLSLRHRNALDLEAA